MWLYLQMWVPLFTVSMVAAICLTVAAFVMSHQAPRP
jgi:hypothetical protein